MTLAQKERLLQAINSTLLGLDDQFRVLHQVFETYDLTGKGQSCLLVGPPCSGKSALLAAVIQSFREKFHEDNCIQIDGAYCGEAEGTKTLDIVDSRDAARLVVVDNFEQFALRARQQLLYTIMNQVCSSNCLVVLVSSDMMCIEAFEKRVRSRFSQKQIVTISELGNKPIQLLQELLCPTKWECSVETLRQNWVQFVEKLCKDKFLARMVDNLAAAGFNQSISTLKQFAILLVNRYFGHEPEFSEKETLQLLNLLLPPSGWIREHLMGLELREIFILELMRRFSLQMGRCEVSYLDIFQYYCRALKAIHYTRGKSKDVVYSSLNALLRKRVIEVKEGAAKAQLDHKPVHLCVDSSLVESVWKTKAAKSYLCDVFTMLKN